MNIIGNLKNCLVKFFTRKEDDQNDERQQESSRKLPQCSQNERIKKLISIVASVLKAYTLVGLYAFFFVLLCFTTNVLLDLVLEMLSPNGDKEPWQSIMFRVITSILILSFVLNSFFCLQVVWEVIQAFHKEDKVWHFWMRLLFFIVDFVFGLILALTKHSDFTGFLEYLFLASFVKAGMISVFGSVFLVRFVFRERNEKIFPRHKKSFWKTLLYIFATFFALSLWPCLFMYILSGSSGLPITLSFLLPASSYIVLLFLFFRGSTSKDKKDGFLLRPIFMLLIVLVFLAVMVVFFVADHECDKSCQLLSIDNLRNKRAANQGIDAKNPNVAGYQMCSKKWGSLTITDMVFFADLAYKFNEKKDANNLASILKDYFKRDGLTSKWTVELINSYKPSFYHIRNAANGVNVVGIRGTNDFRDWIENGKIWNEVLVYQCFFSFVPLSGTIPTNTIATYIKFASIVDYVYSTEKDKSRSYIDVIENFLENPINKRRRQREKFYLVGHSLGGGLAKIIGSRLKIEAIAISSPGEIYNHKKYGYTLDDLQKYTTSFGARDDIISKIDKQGGLVQNVERESTGSLWETHSIKNTYCDIKKKCSIPSPVPCKTPSG